MTSLRTLIKLAAFAWMALPLSTMLSPAHAADDKVQLMFVQSAESLKADDKTLRPKRVAGHLTMPAYLEEWTAAAGPNNFAKNPPNATLSVYEAGQGSNTLAVVTLSQPVVEGKDLVYSYKLVEGKVPPAGGPTSLFIDWIGVGGGVGPGFHGVGVGARGVGWR
jgi:hypothetical protein